MPIFAAIINIIPINMNNIIGLQQATIQEVSMLFNNENALRKVFSYAKKLREKVAKEEAEKSEKLTAKEKKEILNDIREALIEVKLAKEGKIKLHSLEEVLNEI